MTLQTFSTEPPLEKVETLSTLRVGTTFSVSLSPLSRWNVRCTASPCTGNPWHHIPCSQRAQMRIGCTIVSSQRTEADMHHCLSDTAAM